MTQLLTVTDVRFAPGDGPDARVAAYCDLVLNGVLAVHAVKLLRGADGRLHLGMPAKKITDRCPRCAGKNALVERYCGHCGLRRDGDRTACAPCRGEGAVYDFDVAVSGDNGRVTCAQCEGTGRRRTHRDFVHPVTAAARRALTDAVVAAWEEWRSAPAPAVAG